MRAHCVAIAATTPDQDQSQPFVPEKALRVCLGIAAIVTAVLYVIQAVS
jgi:hypothetical protein